tara:strand:- start:126 stop:320 length:195 start_codon:yes stop_codon:yes gene_type:complete
MINLKEVEIYSKQVFGSLRFFPVNENAKILIKLMKNGTFSRADIDLIKSLGFHVKQVVDPKEKL